MAVGGELLTSALAGLAFIGCAMTNAAGAPAAGAGQGRRREVVVNGKRVKTVDIHAHCIVPEAAAVINHPLEAPGLLWAIWRTASRRWTRRGSMSRRSASTPIGTARSAMRRPS